MLIILIHPNPSLAKVDNNSSFHCRLLRIGLTVPEMDIAGLYRINGEVFILPLEGGGSFSSKMSRVTATGHSTILPYTNEEGNQVQWGEI